MASRRKVFTLITQAAVRRPLNKVFLTDLMSAIEQYDRKNSRKPSRWYKPSSFTCMRQMYFMRTETDPDNRPTEYQSVGMADTGSRRHEAVQEVLLSMEEMGFDWRYVDVAEYLADQQAKGFCLNIEVKGTRGAETKLFDRVLQISFMCDGIIQQISTGKFYLFEFKNQVSFKFRDKEAVDKAHIDQVCCYCLELNLSGAFVTYENRDVCELECPELFQVTDEMKAKVVEKIMECESYVERQIPPPCEPSTKLCKWCQYTTACRKAGR